MGMLEKIMVNKIAFGLLVVLISSGMGLGIAKNVETKENNLFLHSNQIQYANNLVIGAPTDAQHPTGPHLSMDEIIKAGNEFVANYKTGIQLVRIIETSKYFYMAFRETGSGIGAFEILADPVTGQFGLETGPTQLWNTKYGFWGSSNVMNNNIPREQAQFRAMTYLKNQNSASSIDPDPIVFYGYYTFFERQADQIIGVISVNGFTGDVEPHSWLGNVLQTKEFSSNKA
jgi:hypothetical protein